MARPVHVPAAELHANSSTWCEVEVFAAGCHRYEDVASGVKATISCRHLAGRDYVPVALSAIIFLIRAADLLAIVAAAWLTYLLYSGVMAATPAAGPLGSQHLAAVGAAVLISAVAFHACKAYTRDYLLFCCGSIARVLTGWLSVIALLLLVAFALKVSGHYSRLWILSWFVATPFLILLERQLFLTLIGPLLRRLRLTDCTVILGAGEHGQRVAANIEWAGDVQVRLVGFIDDRLNRVPGTIRGYPVLGNTDQLQEIIHQNSINRVVIALPWSEEKRILQLVARLATMPVTVVLAPDSIVFEAAAHSFVRVGRLPMLQLLDRPIYGWAQVAKDLEDRAGAVLLLLLAAPLLALIALAVKLDSPGPVIFRQWRYGRNNGLIEVWKFRTMHTRFSDPDCAVQARANDPRVTRVGRFLRAWSLDELPQLVNVLRGEMSLVGPRPHATLTSVAGCSLEEAVINYPARHRVKPGMTGWAQVNGWRGPTDTLEKITKRVEYDLYYIDNWSIWFDLQILLRTVVAVLSRVNSY
jgi:Undecaprenyl-phosphate glucose phosphotransferase